ncbi:unnamed protein product [Paramecium sonneborni]|uniref:Zeta toxin domain-containing protein n=1 Tax=Paramecium sonneborni TaxID=65129 RepID=A0A8S1PG57_9CILI|nr:unnamed protein product [Paramecium sonneborni]
MQTFRHVDKNVIFVLKDKEQNKEMKRQIRKINKEKLKIILQISGCKASHSYHLCEKIFVQILSTFSDNIEKQKNALLLDEISNEKYKQITINEREFKEHVFSSLLEKKYIQVKGELYKEDFEIAWSLTEKKQPLIILLGGTSGTGKSTASSILASRFGISIVLSTDSIRHIMRNFISKDDNPVLFASTYEAGKTLPDLNISDQRRTIKGYKAQCQLVQQRLEYVIENFNQKMESIIIEGVHLTPIFMMKIMKKYQLVLPFAICIKKESKHKERFAVRSKYMTLDSRHNKYIENFQNIRLIQKWFLEKADEFLIPKVDNVNVDKSIDTIHRTIIQYIKHSSTEVQINDLKNALPIYEEFNKIINSVISDAKNSKEVKDYIHSKVNKSEIVEQFIQQMNEYQVDTNTPMIQESDKSNPKVLIQQSVQKFNEINLKNEKADNQNNLTNKTEVNYIVDDQNEKKDNINHISDQEDETQERRRRNQDKNTIEKLKKTKSLENMVTMANEEQTQKEPAKELTIKKNLRVVFQELEYEKEEQELNEQRPHKTNYKGILQHLTKHKRIFISKKIQSSNLIFIKKMISNYNKNYQSHDRIKLLQNNDGSYCLFKINVQKIQRKTASREESSSEPDDNDQSVAQQGKSFMTPSNFPFSERRDQSDGDSVRFRNDGNSDEEEIENDNDNENSVEEASSSEEEGALENLKSKINDDEEDFFELQNIIEEDEFQEDMDPLIQNDLIEQQVV